jgi:catechol 2,3-dioxygenase-like lactoylglutathione lyase family enzyme
MLAHAKLVAFLATADAARARSFYEGVLGLRVVEDQPFALVLEARGTKVRIQKVEKVMRVPYTSLGWEVSNLGETVRSLAQAGVVFARYPGMQQDEMGVWTSPSGAKVVWFEDPDGNVLSLTGSG